ncbi:MAG: hypothetical protein UV38_C0001G0282 [candidate division TM6 bacterium GW2011_GWE2_42_60]|nr:MAG: hypothetical protein UV38_C0001G0282 [candidate division TM6 bacterium GW2011_GWE2_42_60]HBY05525.1 hypothetical protein [Candidatus Dependentiae bacterium]
MLIKKSIKSALLSLGLLLGSVGFAALSASNQVVVLDKAEKAIVQVEKEGKVFNVEERKSQEPYYSWIGKIFSKARKGYEKFIVTYPTGSALIVSLVEGSLVGFYLYKLKPGEKVSSKKAIIAALVTAVNCFSLRKTEHQGRASNVGITDIQPVLKKDAASLPLELAVRGADLLWQLLFEMWFLSHQVKLLDGVVTDEWRSTLSKYCYVDQLHNYVNSHKNGLVVPAVKDVARYVVIPVINTAIFSTSLLAHELGHGFINKLITGDPFDIFIGVPEIKYNFISNEYEDNPLYSTKILGVPAKIYPVNPFALSFFCGIDKWPSSSFGKVAVSAAGPLGGIAGVAVISGARNLITKKSLLMEQASLTVHADNLFNPYLKVSPQCPSDSARIYHALGINP